MSGIAIVIMPHGYSRQCRMIGSLATAGLLVYNFQSSQGHLHLGGMTHFAEMLGEAERCCHEVHFETRRCVKMRLQGELTSSPQGFLAGFEGGECGKEWKGLGRERERKERRKRGRAKGRETKWRRDKGK